MQRSRFSVICSLLLALCLTHTGCFTTQRAFDLLRQSCAAEGAGVSLEQRRTTANIRSGVCCGAA